MSIKKTEPAVCIYKAEQLCNTASVCACNFL